MKNKTVYVEDLTPEGLHLQLAHQVLLRWGFEPKAF
jgi:hypothetical protein